MPSPKRKPLPLSQLRPIVRRAKFVADYVQGTMGLEGQGLDAASRRRLLRLSITEAVRAAS